MAEVDWRKSSNYIKKACLNVIDSLVADHYTYLNFDISSVVDTPEAPKDQIIMALIVKVAGGNRTIAANNIEQSLKKKLDDKKFDSIEVTKGGNRLDVYLKGDFGIKKSGKYKGTAIQKRIILAVKPEGRDTGGSGGGARETKRNECAQCLYADVVFNQLGRKFTSDEISGRETELVDVKVWEDAYSNIEVDDAEKELLPTGNVLEFAWRQSHMKGANELYDELGSPMKGTYKFYRGLGFDGPGAKKDTVSSAYSRCNNTEGSYFSSEDKWNPADIWAIHKDYPLTGHGSIGEKGDDGKAFVVKTYAALNAHVRAHHKDNKLLGISLKKHEGSGKSNIKTINENKDKGWDKKIWDKVGEVNKNDWFFVKGKWDSSMDIYIQWGKGKFDNFQCRNFGGDSTSSWQLELKGASAAQGRCGGGVAIDSIKDNNVTFPLNTWTALTSWGSGDSGNTAIWSKCDRGNSNLDKVIDDIASLTVKHFGVGTKIGIDDACKNPGPAGKAAMAQLKQVIRGKSQSWRYSKLVGLCFIDAISSKGNVDLCVVLRDLYLYASSQTKHSAIHWKLT